MAKRAKAFIEVQEEFRPWPYGDSTERYRYMIEKPKPVRVKKKKDPYSALTSRKSRSRKDDKHPSS